jgi:hypothetical protein
MRACLRFSLPDSEKSTSSVIDGKVCAVGKGSASAYAEITGLSTALVCSGPDTVSVRRSHVHIKETSGAVAVGTARFCPRNRVGDAT